MRSWQSRLRFGLGILIGCSQSCDPHLGSRFSGYTREEVLAAAEYTDVMGFNIYRARVNPADRTVLDGIDKPLVIAEFHMGALDRGMFHPGLVSTPNQAARAAIYQDYVRYSSAAASSNSMTNPLTGDPETARITISVSLRSPIASTRSWSRLPRQFIARSTLVMSAPRQRAGN
jgi:hypothetical protein